MHHMHIYCILMSIYIYASEIPSLNAPNSQNNNSNSNSIVVIIIILSSVYIYTTFIHHIYKFHARISTLCCSCFFLVVATFLCAKRQKWKISACLYIRPNCFWSMRILVPDICIWHCLIYLSTSVRVITYCATAQSYCVLLLLCAVKARTKLWMYVNKRILSQMLEYFLLLSQFCICECVIFFDTDFDGSVPLFGCAFCKVTHTYTRTLRLTSLRFSQAKNEKYNFNIHFVWIVIFYQMSILENTLRIRELRFILC